MTARIGLRRTRWKNIETLPAEFLKKLFQKAGIRDGHGELYHSVISSVPEEENPNTDGPGKHSAGVFTLLCATASAASCSMKKGFCVLQGEFEL